MTPSTLTHVLPGLDAIAELLESLADRAVHTATRDDVLHYNEAYGYMVGAVMVYAEQLRKDIKLLRDNLSLGGDTDGASLD